jgi:hypothetical protein
MPPTGSKPEAVTLAAPNDAALSAMCDRDRQVLTDGLSACRRLDMLMSQNSTSGGEVPHAKTPRKIC